MSFLDPPYFPFLPSHHIPRLLLLLLLLLAGHVVEVEPHARLMEPPSRASMWRLGFDNPPDFNDHQGFCGGFKHQYGRMGGQCGICGDPADAWPRQHEAPGGRFANGLITRQYKPGQDIVVKVDVTANHKGFFTFKLCSNNDTAQDPRQECFDKTVLRVVPSGEDRYYLTTFNTGVFTLKLRLPQHIWCDQCILQWTYTAGNNWGSCEKERGSGLGCGPQENFRACADISIAGSPSKSAPFELNPKKTITTKSRAPNVVVNNLFEIDKSAFPLDPEGNSNDVDGGLDKKNKPIPFLIRNTTAKGMPISIGALRPVDTPSFTAFNPFIKRLPPPKKYVFEPRQVLAGDVVDPYNYLRSLFRGEIILTSDKLPTFASPRVWGMTTASTMGKFGNGGTSYTTRSPQGFNPWITKKPPASPSLFFGGNIGHTSKGKGTEVEAVPLPVGMLGTPSPDFKDFNFKDFIASVKDRKPLGGTLKDLLPVSQKSVNKVTTRLPTQTNFKNPSAETMMKSFDSNPLPTVKSDMTKETKSPSIEDLMNSFKNNGGPTLESVMNSFKEKDTQTLDGLINDLKNKDIPTIDSIMKTIKSQKTPPFTSFASLPAVPGQTKDPMFSIIQAVPTESSLPFSAVPAVPGDQTIMKDRSPKTLPGFDLSNIQFPEVDPEPISGLDLTSNPFPTFIHFPASSEDSLNRLQIQSKDVILQQMSFSDKKRKNEALEKLREKLFGKNKVKEPKLTLPADSTSTLFKDSITPATRPPIGRQFSNFGTPQSQKFRQTTPRSRLGAKFSNFGTPKSHKFQRPTTVRPRLPQGTTRSEIMALLNAHKTTTLRPILSQRTTPRAQLFEQLQLQSTTSSPNIQSTTNRAEVLRLLQQLLQSVKPTPSTTTTKSTTLRTTTSRTTTTTTSSWKSPALRFDEPSSQLRLQVAVTPPPMSPVTPATLVHPHSPFPNLEPPQHDMLSSNIFLPNPMASVTPASTVHPHSPFHRLEAPKPTGGPNNFPESALDLFPTPQGPRGRFNTGFLTGTLFGGGNNNAVPRSDTTDQRNPWQTLPHDPARPHLPPQSQRPTEKPGQFKLRLDSRSNKDRNGRKFNEHINPKFHTPRPNLEAPPPIYPVPRTRMIAPRSQQTAMNRRLSIDGPTESSLTPLEILARETVPKFKPDKSFFGTPRSRIFESQTPLEQLVSGLSSNKHGVGFGELEPIERIRYQREQENKKSKVFQAGLPPESHQSNNDLFGVPQNMEHSLDEFNYLPNMPKKKQTLVVRQKGAIPYRNLPGVKTGTTAVGLVEHRNNNQPLFHVPIFTTPIPKNGQFINMHHNPLRGFQSTIRNITSSISKKIPKFPSPREGLERLKKVIQNKIGIPKVRDIQITSAPKSPAIVNNFQQVPRQLQASTIGRRLDTFSRYTKMANFRNGAEQSNLFGDNLALTIFMSTVLILLQ